MDKHRLIHGEIVAVVTFVIVLSVVVVLRNITPPSSCIPTKTIPDLDSFNIKTILSSEQTALANFVGYLKFVDDDTYLPIELNNVFVINGVNKKKIVILTSNCVTFEVSYKKSLDAYASPIYNFGGIIMFVKNGAKNDRYPNVICAFDHNLFSFKQSSRFRYSCPIKQAHSCSILSANKTANKVAKLVIKSFELELEVNAEAALIGKFAKKPSTCQG